MHVIGEIEGRNCVIMDDMIDTAGTLVKAAEVLKERGAKKVVAYCTHAVLLGPGDRAHRQARRSTRWWSPTPSRCRDDARGLHEDPPAVRGAAVRRDDPAHRQGRVGDVAVLGSGQSFLRTSSPQRPWFAGRPF